MARAKNPIGPEVICNAFREACGDFASGIKVKLIVMKLFDRYVVTEEVRSLYLEVNRVLIEKGVLPDLRYDIKRVPGRAESTDAAGDEEDNSEDFYTALQKLMLKGGAASNIASAAVISGLVGALTQLQQGNMAQLGGSLGNVDQATLMSGTVNVIRDMSAVARP